MTWSNHNSIHMQIIFCCRLQGSKSLYFFFIIDGLTHPFTLQDMVDGKSAGGISVEHSGKKNLKFGGCVTWKFDGKIGIAYGFVARERIAPEDGETDCETERPNFRFRPNAVGGGRFALLQRFLLLPYFRTSEPFRSIEDLCARAVMHLPGSTEIDDLNVVVFVDDQVGRFDISVKDAVPVQASDGAGHLTEDVGRLRFT